MQRRDFLFSSVGALAGLALGGDTAIAHRLLHPELYGLGVGGVPADRARELALAAVDAARAAGAEYADIRLSTLRYQATAVWNRNTRPMRIAETFGYGVRVLVNGMWGQSAGTEATIDAVTRAARNAVQQARAHRAMRRVALAPLAVPARGEWTRPVKIDPFTVPVEDQIGLMLAANEAALKIKGIGSVYTTFDFMSDMRTFASTDGALITQNFIWTWPWVGSASATATSPTDRTHNTQRYVDLEVTGRGYEAVLEADLVNALPRAAEESVAMLGARSVDVGRYDLVFAPRALAAPLGDTLGVALQLDRVLGYEANAGGTTFITPEDAIGKLQLGSPLLSLHAERSTPGANATARWDDEGVATGAFDLIRDGFLTTFQTNREMASELSTMTGRAHTSNACAFAPLAGEMPLVNTPNLRMRPASGTVTLDDLIRDVKRGLLVTGRSRGEADQQQLNAQYSPAVAQEIRDGRIVGYLKDVAFQFITPQFWKALDAVGDASTLTAIGNNQAKGQPRQIALQSMITTAARFRQINVFNTGRRA